MAEQKSIGQILVGMGRITEEQVTEALEYQKENGGFFGAALVACGHVTEEELDFGLASQFDLPYVFPDADAVDSETAALVSREWALTNLTIPILQAGNSLTVIVESPLRSDPVDELRERTGLEIELALASAANIRDVVRQVYARGAAVEEEDGPPVSAREAMDQIIADGASIFGVSVRGERALVWWDDNNAIYRRPLGGDWSAAFDRGMVPPPSSQASGTNDTSWEAKLSHAGTVIPVDVRYLADESGYEYLFIPGEPEAAPEARFAAPPPGVVSEVQMLARSGKARFIVTTEVVELGHSILPHLPGMLIDPSWRTVYLHAAETDAADEAFSVGLSSDAGGWSDEFAALRPFRFDAVTVDLAGGNSAWVDDVLDIASAAFLLWGPDEDRAAATAAGIRWRIHISGQGDEAEWSLTPLTN